MVGKSIVLLLVAALAAVGWSKHHDRIEEQDRLAVVASGIVGHKVDVHCPNLFKKLVSVSGEAGTVKFDEQGRPASYTDLAPETCDALKGVDEVDLSCLDSATCDRKQWKLAWALHTLAHEAFHLRGIRSEAIAECYALQNTAFVAERLGVPARQAQELQRWVYVKGYPNEPDEYRSDECADGGTLDLRPETSRFP